MQDLARQTGKRNVCEPIAGDPATAHSPRRSQAPDLDRVDGVRDRMLQVQRHLAACLFGLRQLPHRRHDPRCCRALHQADASSAKTKCHPRRETSGRRLLGSYLRLSFAGAHRLNRALTASRGWKANSCSQFHHGLIEITRPFRREQALRLTLIRRCGHRLSNNLR